MDVLTPFFRARFISNLITFFIIWNYAESQLKKYYAQEYQLDEKQVIDNIKNDRRFDWGTGQEDNWRHSWNSANPIERKKITKRNIMLKCFLLYFFGGTILEVLTNVFLS